MRCNAMHNGASGLARSTLGESYIHRTVVPVPYGTCRLPTAHCRLWSDAAVSTTFRGWSATYQDTFGGRGSIIAVE